MINLSRNNWASRWLLWSQSILDEFWNAYKLNDIRARGTNLCQFMRIVLVWTPAVLIIHIALLILWICVLVVYPIYAFGAFVYGGTLIGVAGVAVGVFVLTYAWSWVNGAIDDTGAYVVSNLEKRYMVHARRKAKRRDEHGPGPFGLLWLWLVSIKHKTCPLIKFGG